MHIEELGEESSVVNGEGQLSVDVVRSSIIISDAKRVLVGAGARALFYPTLLYNVVRNKIQSEFHWWDRVDQFLLLGAVPFPTDVPQLKELGVGAVVTLNEPYETLVPTELYGAHDISHLVIPTRDYMFAPSFGDVCQAVNFIHEYASRGKTTYVHCKAGRGRSTTIVLCYLMEHREMTPEAAYDYVRSIRPRILLASSQWKAVQHYYFIRARRCGTSAYGSSIRRMAITSGEEEMARIENEELTTFDDGSVVLVMESDLDDGSVVLVTKSDLDGYDKTYDSSLRNNKVPKNTRLACRVQCASQAAMSRLSCLWVRKSTDEKLSRKKLPGSIGSDQIANPNLEIRVH